MSKNILIPRNIDSRKIRLTQLNTQLLSQEVIKGYLEINESFEEIPEELIKVKEIYGNVRLLLYKGYIPSWLKHVKIYGYFNCSSNNLKSLENCPQYVSGVFSCKVNKLETLEGCPKYIGGHLYCSSNKNILLLPEGIELKGNIYNQYYNKYYE